MIRSVITFFLFAYTLHTAAQDPVYDNLVWSDEFEGSGAIDGSKWHHQTQLPNGGSWYNGEIQHYTDREDNSYQQNGSLFINAKRETYFNQGVTKEFTSARLNSKFSFTYGRVEIRGILPTGVGTWPAMWTLGKNIIEPGAFWSSAHGTVGWPACGELDIMEHWGNNQDYVQSAIHTPSSSGATVNFGGRLVPNASNTFHIYEMEWFPNKIVFKIDGTVHYTYEPSVQNAETWPFDADQYLLLNVAVLPEIAASFTESAMEIDYVRVYQETLLAVTDVSLRESIKIFPNPFDEHLTIEIPQEYVGATLRLYGVLGRELHTEQLTTSNVQIDLSSLPKGIYLIKVETNAGSFTQSVLK